MFNIINTILKGFNSGGTHISSSSVSSRFHDHRQNPLIILTSCFMHNELISHFNAALVICLGRGEGDLWHKGMLKETENIVFNRVIYGDVSLCVCVCVWERESRYLSMFMDFDNLWRTYLTYMWTNESIFVMVSLTVRMCNKGRLHIWLSRQSNHHIWLASCKIWSVEGLETLLVGTDQGHHIIGHLERRGMERKCAQ